MCTYTLKHVIDYFTQMDSPSSSVIWMLLKKLIEYISGVLFDNLLNQGMPVIVVWLLVFLYTKQAFFIRWGNSTSEAFVASNRVRQGRGISPHLFNVYVNNLSKMLKEPKRGCFMNNTPFNTDDTVLSPSTSGSQHL